MFNGKIRCIGSEKDFTVGKIYEVINGRLKDDDGYVFSGGKGFESFEQINRSLSQSQFELISEKPNIADTGNRTEFGTGAVRDMHTNKGRMDLLPACALVRLSKHFENGALKYDERNWEKGIPIHSYIDSALRHLMKYLDGMTDEDHLCAATWNCMCAMWTEEKKPELQDIPTRKEFKNENN